MDEGVSIAAAVPTIRLGLLAHCRATGRELGPLRRIFCGGTAPPAAMIESDLRDHGVRVSHGWGMTETIHGASISFAGHGLSDEATVAAMRMQGKPLHGAEIRIVDDEDRPLSPDGTTPGHLQCCGHWTAGACFKRPALDLRTNGGWMRTGDIAAIDPANTLLIVDRAKDAIKSGGEWITSQALEEAATRHPAVQQAAVVAMPHVRWQERPCMIVVVVENANVTDEALRAHRQSFVPKWWLPDAIAAATEPPHGPTGKRQKDELRRRVADGTIAPVMQPSPSEV